MRSILLLTCGCVLSLATPRTAFAARPAFAYVNNSPAQGAGTVVAYRVNGVGQSTSIPGSPYSTGGLGMTQAVGSEFAHRIEVSKSRNLLFASNDGSGSVSVFRIDPERGSLTSVVGSPFAIPNWNAFPGISLAVSSDGRFLYASGSTLVSCFIDDQGALWPIGSQWQLAQRVGGMAVAPDNTRLYATVPNGVIVLATGEGGLTTDAPDFLSVGSSASDLRLDAQGQRLWVGTKNGGILAYTLSAAGSSIVPDSPFLSAISNLSGLSVDPSARFLVAYSPIEQRLLGAKIDPNGSSILRSGQINPPIAPTGAPLSPDGSLLLLADAQSRLDAWLTQDDGSLTHLDGYPISTGAAPGLATVATFPDKSPTPAPASPAWWTLACATALALIGGRRAQLARG